MTNASGDQRPGDVRWSVVIPAHNEADAIAGVVEGVCEQFADSLTAGLSEVIVVDDGSHDGTASAVAALPVRIVRVPERIGNGAAVKAGIRAATGEFVLLLDGDGQHLPTELPALMDHAGPYDMVVGVRSAAGQATRARRIANGIFNRLASYVTGRRVEDLTSGFRAVRRSLATEFIGLLPNGFSYPTTITLAALRSGFSVRYVPVRVAPRRGVSKLAPARDGFRFLLIISKLATLFSPMKFFGPLAGLLVGGGAVLAGASLAGADLWTPAAVLTSGAAVVAGLGLWFEAQVARRILEHHRRTAAQDGEFESSPPDATRAPS